MSDVFGSDIRLDSTGQAMVAANGELLLTSGVATGVQDVRLRLLTPLGELFYDVEFGSLIHQWYRDENTLAARQGFVAEVISRVEDDPRAVLGSVECSITTWDDRGFTVTARFEFIDEDHPFNLVISYDSAKNEMVINDVNPRSGL